MNASDILTAYKLAKNATKVWNEILHGGKEFLGEVNIQDSIVGA